MHCLLAVDAGGTKAEALLVTLAGQVLGRGLCRPDIIVIGGSPPATAGPLH